MYKIILPKVYPQKGQIVINNRVFVDGVCEVNDADAQLVVPIFKSFYGAKIEKVAEAASKDAEPKGDAPSLKAGQTKA